MRCCRSRPRSSRHAQPRRRRSSRRSTRATRALGGSARRVSRDRRRHAALGSPAARRRERRSRAQRVVGGCCGTTPEQSLGGCCGTDAWHIRAVRRGCRDESSSAGSGIGLTSLRHVVAALHRGPRGDREIPTLEIGIRRPVDALPFVARDPRPGRDVGDRIVAGEILGVAEPFVQHAVDSLRLVAVAFLGVLGLAAIELQEVMRLPEHRADASHLHHQPLDGCHRSCRRRAAAPSCPRDRAGSRPTPSSQTPLSWSTIAGILLFGLMREKLGLELLIRR